MLIAAPIAQIDNQYFFSHSLTRVGIELLGQLKMAESKGKYSHDELQEWLMFGKFHYGSPDTSHQEESFVKQISTLCQVK